MNEEASLSAVALVVGINIVIAVVMWVLTRMYSESLVRGPTCQYRVRHGPPKIESRARP